MRFLWTLSVFVLINISISTGGFRDKRADIFQNDKSENQHQQLNIESGNGSLAEGRGIISEIVDTVSDTMSSLVTLQPITAVKNLISGIFDVGAETMTRSSQLAGIIHQGIRQLGAAELNDLWEHNEKEIYFKLFTQQNKNDPQIIPHNGGIEGTFFNPSKGLKLIVHGFSPDGAPVFDIFGARKTSTQNLIGQLTIKNSYLKMGLEDNIIVVDWTSIAQTVLYLSAAAGTHVVGHTIANFLIKLHEKGQIRSVDVHVIGFSLGSQSSGIAGHMYHEETGEKLGRITGLDPAGPGFDLLSNAAEGDKRFIIDKGDARFVDIIHCNSGLYGTSGDNGHVTFFPNGGSHQPHCDGLTDNLLASCSHSRCWQFYSESVEMPQKYPAQLCGNYDQFLNGTCQNNAQVFMGDYCNPKSRGLFYLKAEISKNYSDDFVKEAEGK